MSDLFILATKDVTNLTSLWIACDENQIKYGQCKFNINKPLMIKEENDDPTPSSLLEDGVLGATFFIGAVVTVGLIISALKLIYGSIIWGDVDTYKKSVTSSLIWLIIVLWAYIIVRVIQYLART